MDRFEVVEALEAYAKHMHKGGRTDESIKKELLEAVKYVIKSEDYKFETSE